MSSPPAVILTLWHRQNKPKRVTVPLHHSYFCVSSAYKQKRPKIFCVRSKQQNECTLNRCEVIYGTEGINDIKRPLCVALLADDVNNKMATCFFSCRSSLFDAGRPLSFSVSPSLSPSAIVCPSEFTLDSLPLVLTHTHILFLPRGCVWLRHEINFRACTLPPWLWRPFSLTMKRDCCCASLRINPPTTLMPPSCPRILQCSTLVSPGSLPSSSSPVVQSSCGALSFLLYVAQILINIWNGNA